MRTSYLFGLLIFLGFVVFACAQTIKIDGMEKKDAMTDKTGKSMQNDTIQKTEESISNDEAMMEKPTYAGKALAGTETTKYLEFNTDDYEKALKEKKKILLYFYANWCPICKKEQSETFEAFSKLNDPDLIGFRVNYRDSDTDEDEEALAKEFGVSYQHTKVVIKDGKRALKSPESWDKQRYLDELSNV
ncbi:MAG: thioredoxin family protein [Nanoarchaeota archaeon]